MQLCLAVECWMLQSKRRRPIHVGCNGSQQNRDVYLDVWRDRHDSSILCDTILQRCLLQALCQQCSPYALQVHLVALHQLQDCLKRACQGEGRKQAKWAALSFRHLQQTHSLVLICTSMLELSRQYLSWLT